MNCPKQTHPRDKANFFSHFLHCWQLRLLMERLRKNFNEEDVVAPVRIHESKPLGDQLEKLWNNEQDSSKKPSLTRVLVKMFGFKLILHGVLFCPVDVAVCLLPPTFLRDLLNYFTLHQSSITKREALFDGLIILLAFLIRALSFNTLLLELTSLGMKFRIACSSLIYRKLLKMKSTTIQNVSLGHIVNLLSNDVEQFDKAVISFNFLWIGPLKVIIAAYYLVVTYGYSSIVGMVVPVLCLLIQMILFRKLFYLRMILAAKVDSRVRVLSDTINGIRSIKMFTWEKPFAKLVDNARKAEMRDIAKGNCYRISNFSLAIFFQKTSVFLCILVAVLYNETLTPQYVFALLIIYDALRQTSHLWSWSLISTSELMVSLRRIEQFLLLEQKHTTNLPLFIEPSLHNIDRNINKLEKGTEEFDQLCGVSLKNVNAKWDVTSSNSNLVDVTITATTGQLVAVVGVAGSGKSTLLQVIVKEVPHLSGNLNIRGSLSYAPQEPWIFTGTLRENILFGENMDERKYQEVIRVCCLEHDISSFSYGDNTLVGEKGVMLSGGQKARVSLARAIYRDADVYLLDDPFSAVDVYVANKIFYECIRGHLKNKCVILVTHQVQFLENVDKVLLLDKGKVKASGNYTKMEGFINKSVEKSAEKNSSASIISLKKYDIPSETHEDRGTDTLNPYKSYCLAGHGWTTTCLLVMFFAFTQVLVNLYDCSLKIWVDSMERSANSKTKIHNLFDDTHFLFVCGTLLLIIIVSCYSNVGAAVVYCKYASKYLHIALLDKVLAGSLVFFNNHSSGRILNRFSKDMGMIDEFVPVSLSETVKTFLHASGALVLLIIFNYWMIIPTVALFLLIYFYASTFKPMIANVKGIEGTRRSPIFTHTTASVKGLSTIRAFKAEKHSILEFDNYQDLHSSVYYLHKAFYFSFAFWSDITCAFYISVALMCIIIFDNGMSVGQYLMKCWNDLDYQMTSVKRVVEYADVTPEAFGGTFMPPESWPSEGNVTFSSVSMRYSADKPLVLKQVNLIVQSGEKIGIVGRTGAGKSSLISAIFHLYDFDGRIFIDGIDTKKLSLHTLRSKIAIIPQEPVLFLGTLRQNLDPFTEYEDYLLWDALEDVELKEFVSGLPSGLESAISEGGSNFSVGQRQLLCLVRAILKNAKIVILDEATASVDLETDKMIQRTIRKKFKNSTVLTIAHRTNTVIDSDKILVMDSGSVVEFDDTENILQHHDEYFRNNLYFQQLT
ncbi:probable multidrug resistance-associated protein lethal(2)03659 isoform X2 [Tenebrio molitor]|uniref:probable multidrug resistance-associated protein lethal(2)03659 isoform X2 n=1 Tax=Tenebrio molitor TaxID=7067 RepID=UPI0036249761